MQSFLQSNAWEEFVKQEGLKTIRFSEQLFSLHSFRFGSYAYVSRCELTEDFSLKNFPAKSCFIRFEPLDNASLGVIKKLGKLQKSPSIQPRQTSLVDISGTEEQIIQNMKQKARYNLRLAQKADLQIETYSENAETQFERFWTLLQLTAERQDFRTHPKRHYQLLLKNLAPKGLAHLIFASCEGQDLAGMLLLTFNDTATYLHGASLPIKRELMAPSLMHFSAIQLAKAKNCTIYD